MATANIGNNIEASEEFYCPITKQLMNDPVISTDDSMTYERSAIVTWLSRPGCTPVSPTTRVPMNIAHLFPNRPLKNLIEEYKMKNIGMSSVPSSIAYNSTAPNSTVSPNIKRDLQIDCSVTSNPNELYIMIESTKDAIEENMSSTDDIWVLDVSGSMDTEASKANDSGEKDGLTRLDLVKYSTLAGINSMSEKDRACIITFSDCAKELCPLTYMNHSGKQSFDTKLKTQKTEGCTDLWAGIKKGIEVVSTINDMSRNITINVLTDGEPSTTPSKGFVASLKEYIDKKKLTQAFTINFIGFGYQLKPALLAELSIEGAGVFRHIPDGSMVGSTFINLSAISKSTHLSNCTLDITVDGKLLSTQMGPYGNKIGSIILGQKRQLIFNVPNLSKTQKILLEVRVGAMIIISKEFHSYNLSRGQHQPTTVRYKIISTLNEILKANSMEQNLHQSKLTLDRLFDEFKRMLNNDTITPQDKGEIENYIMDYYATDRVSGGQIKASIDTDVNDNRWKRWGEACLHSISSAYYFQQCTNFKDKGIQNFSGSLFEINRTKADETFETLPPPIPTSSEYVHRQSRSNRPLTPPNMSVYNNRGGSCFSGNGMVAMGDYSYVRVDCLKPNDIVKTVSGTTKIKYILKTKVPNNKTMVCVLEDGLEIHPYHPVKINKEWIFPIDIITGVEMEIDYWYNIVLEEGHVLYINDSRVITLAHGFTEKVAYHPYYGTQLVVEDLKLMDKNNDKYIVVNNLMICRENDLVVKISDSS